MAKALTQVAVDNAKPGPARREIPDSHSRGLFLIVQPTGVKGWAVRYRFDGRTRKLTIGPYPEIGLAKARAAAAKAKVAIADNVDPAAQKQARRATMRAAKRQASDVVEKVAADFVALHARPRTRDWRETERLLKQFADAWRGRRLSEIGKPDIHAILDRIVARGAPVSANRAFAQLRKMCKWAVSRGLLERSPCEGVDRPSTENSRDRCLGADELRLVWQAADNLRFPFGPITKFLVLTGARRSEVAALEWGELDLDKSVWVLPAARSKNKRQHVLPLSPQAMAIIEGLPRFAGSRFVFGPGPAPPAAFSRAKMRLDGTIAKMNGDKPIAAWVMHDLRRSTASGLAGLGVSLPVVEKILNHVSGSFSGVAGIYQKYNFEAEMRAAMERWGRRVEALASGVAANIVDLAKARG